MRATLVGTKVTGWAGTHHVIGHEGQQDLELVRVDADVGLDSVPGPDGTDFKELGAGGRGRQRPR